MPSERACRVTVHGMVTGVGFRFSTVREAGRYQNLKGYVKNVDSRTVECLVQGPPEEVDEMVEWLRHGPSSARITDCKITDIPVRPERHPFHVEHGY